MKKFIREFVLFWFKEKCEHSCIRRKDTQKLFQECFLSDQDTDDDRIFIRSYFCRISAIRLPDITISFMYQDTTVVLFIAGFIVSVESKMKKEKILSVKILIQRFSLKQIYHDIFISVTKKVRDQIARTKAFIRTKVPFQYRKIPSELIHGFKNLIIKSSDHCKTSLLY